MKTLFLIAQVLTVQSTFATVGESMCSCRSGHCHHVSRGSAKDEPKRKVMPPNWDKKKRKR